MPSRGPGSQWKPRRNWNAKALCANANSDSSERWIVLAPPRKLKKTSPRKSRRRKRNKYMPREIVTLECTEARKLGKSPSRYTTTRNKKLMTEKVEKMKFNPALRKHTLHREIK